METLSSDESVNGSGDQPQPTTSQTTALEAVEGTSDVQPSTPGASDDQQIVEIHDLVAHLANEGASRIQVNINTMQNCILNSEIAGSDVSLVDGDVTSTNANSELQRDASVNQNEELSKEAKLNLAFEELRKAQASRREVDVIIKGLDVKSGEIHVVHPKIVQVSFYNYRTTEEKEIYKPSNKNVKDLVGGKTVQVSDLLLATASETRYVGLIGFPGAGKTTLSKRLAKTEGFKVSFRLSFADIDPESDVTLREILLDDAYPEIKQESTTILFEWLLENQEKAVIIMDGLDQAEWKFDKNFRMKALRKPQHIKNIVAGLCTKHYLPRTKLIITSRPHTMLQLPEKFRPDVTYLLHDLSLEDTKTLFYDFAKDRADQLWNELNTNAPHLISLCQCPLILILYLQAALSQSETGKANEINTMTRIFHTILEDLGPSDNVRYDDINKIKKQLSRIAFRATDQYTVVITTEQLQVEELTSEIVQDLIIYLKGYKFQSSKLFEGKTSKFYFWHQSFQEHFAANHICNIMTLREFAEFLNKLFTGHWSMVRRFVCGIIFDIQQHSAGLRPAQRAEDTTVPSTSGDVTSEAEENIRRQRDEENTETPRGSLQSEIATSPLGIAGISTTPSNMKTKENDGFTSTSQHISTSSKCEKKAKEGMKDLQMPHSPSHVHASSSQESMIRKEASDFPTTSAEELGEFDVPTTSRGSPPIAKKRMKLQACAESTCVTMELDTATAGNFVSTEVWSKLGELEQKRQLLVMKMKEEMKNATTKTKTARKIVALQQFIDLCVEVRECNNSEVTTQVAEYFPDLVRMRNYLHLTSSSAHALSHVMREVTMKVKELILYGCIMDDRTFMYIADGIKSMKTSIGVLDISYNKLTDVKQICGLLNKVKNKLYMKTCFADGEGGWRDANRDETAKLQEALNAIPKTKLKIQVKGDGNEDDKYIYKQH